jgi:glycosyltransferase involved in cell wall biosynthesis
MSTRPQDQRVAILLSSFNGVAFLHAQLESLLSQTHQDWVLYWRDDGSRDSSRAVLVEFAATAGQGRCVEVPGQPGNVGPAASFHALLREVSADLTPDNAVAFADQDDVWLPNKLERGLRALAGVPSDCPALYCARQILVDSRLNRIGLSVLASHDGAFPAALTQNVATGCTVMLNSRAAWLVAASNPSTATQHDWWCYLMVTAAGGRLIQDPEPVILYRQHGGNAVGAPRSMAHRAVGVLKRGRQAFMGVLRRRLSALRLAGLVRQTWVETMVFRAWFILG